jgi:hypothetical protein
MTAVTPAAGDSRKSRLPARRAASPGCGVACEPACSSCRPPSRARLSATWCCPSARPSPTHRVWVLATSNWSRWPSGCKAAGSRRRSATRLRFPQRSPGEPVRAWAVAGRAVGRRVAPCEGRPGTPVTLHRRIPRRLRRLGELRDGPGSSSHQRVTATMWLTTRRGDLIDRGYLCRGALANAAHRRPLTRE